MFTVKRTRTDGLTDIIEIRNYCQEKAPLALLPLFIFGCKQKTIALEYPNHANEKEDVYFLSALTEMIIQNGCDSSGNDTPFEKYIM